MENKYTPKVTKKDFEKLKVIISNALKTNSFYKNKLNKAGFTSITQLKTWEDFTNIPITTRSELMKDQKKSPPFGTNLTRPYSEYKYVSRTSGTSTGTPFFHPLTIPEISRFGDVMAKGDVLMGLTKDDIFCHLAAPWVYVLIYESVIRKIGARVIPVDGYNLKTVLQNIMDMGVTIFQAYPTVIYQLIELAEEEGIDLRKSKVRKIFTIGELGGGIPEVKNYFEEKWGAKVIDHIGQLESGVLAVECENGNSYHHVENYSICEVFEVDNDKPSRKGELVLTSLWRRDFPIIRYRTGDMVQIDDTPCSCGKKSLRFIGGILGRTTGQIKLRAAFVFPEAIERVIKQHQLVKNYQIICKKQFGIDALDVYVELPIFSTQDDLNLLIKDLVNILGFLPQLYPLPIKTLPRFGLQKAKRFHDLRLKKPDKLVFSFSFKTRILSTLFKHAFIWNNRIKNIQKYINFMKNKSLN